MNEQNTAVTFEDISPVKKKLNFAVPWEETKEALDEVFRKIGKTAKVKGFRPGKAPRPVLEAQFWDYAQDEAANNLINRHYWSAVETHEIVPLTQPEIGEIVINKGAPFSFSATIEVEPVIEPRDYLGMKLDKPDLPVKEEDVQARLDQLREMYSTMEDVAEVRKLAEGDFASIDFQGGVDGKPHKGMQADGYLLEIGSRMFIPGFEEQLVGMEVGEIREVKVTFPSDYHEKNLAGKEAVFSVTLKAIQSKKIPPLDEEFVKNFDRYETLADLRTDVLRELRDQNSEKARDQLRTAMIKQLLEKNEFEVPDVLVERQTYYMMADTHRRMSMQGMQPEATAKFIAQLRGYYREEAVQVVKTFLLMKRIAAKEDIVVSEEELHDHIEQMAKQRGQTPEAMKASLEKDGLMEQLKGDLVNMKVFDYLESKADITLVSPPASPEEAEKKEEA